jgi:mono/diheme cytochrome c family protein
LRLSEGRGQGREAVYRPFFLATRYLPARMLILFLLFWILLGLGVFFVAMRGGPRGARQSLHTDSRVGQRLVTVGIVVLFVFGLGVPGLVLAFNGEHKASVGVGGVHLNGEQQKGRELFAHSCAVCHTLAAVKSVGRTGPNLDVKVGEGIATASGRKALVLSAISEGRARGLGQMPALLYQGKEAEEVASFVAAVAGH